MEYTKEQINFIQSRKPEFIPKPVPSLDSVIVEFLERYEVYLKPASTSKRTSNDVASGAAAGAIAGIAGADVAGDAFIVRGQQKQTAIQEWTQWKQWALDHKDFEKFKVEKIDDIKKYNDEISKKLKDPAIQKQLEPLFEELRKKNEQEKELENKVLLFGGGLFFAAFLALVIYAFIESQKNKESFINNQESPEVKVIDREGHNEATKYCKANEDRSKNEYFDQSFVECMEARGYEPYFIE